MKRHLILCSVVIALIAGLPSSLQSQGRCSINRLKVHCTDGYGCGGVVDCAKDGGTYFYAHSIDFFYGCVQCTGSFGSCTTISCPAGCSTYQQSMQVCCDDGSTELMGIKVCCSGA